LEEAFVEEAAAAVHDGWLVRNSRQAQEHQSLPYADLCESEKEKDRYFVRAAIAVCGCGS
jgi:hypothetical protein